MCDIRVKTFLRCVVVPKHQVRRGYNRCQASFARPSQQVCVPPSGQLRDLPLVLDVQDTEVEGECPHCAGRSPSNSSG